jgi:hypothetical protein
VKLLGYTSALDPAFVVNSFAANRRIAQSVRSLLQDVYLVKLSVYADGMGAAGADQALRGAIFDATGNTLAVGSDVVIPAGTHAQWWDLPILVPGGQVLLFDATYLFGIHFGQSSFGARIAAHSLTGIPALQSSDLADLFEDGTNQSIGVVTPIPTGSDLAIYATYVSRWQPPQEQVAYYARLPYAEAQSLLFTGPTPEFFSTTCGWHYTAIDPETGSFCIVDPNGPLAGLLGKRLLITNGTAPSQPSVVAYCQRSIALPTGVPISVTRRLFTELAPLSSANISVRVEVMG